MSRLMNGEEAEAFEKKYGYKVTSIGVAADALAIYVHKDNPIQCLSDRAIGSDIFDRPQGQRRQKRRYVGDAGLTGEWAAHPITMHGRNTISGTYDFFKQQVLYDGNFKESVKQQVGSEAVVQAVANDKFAIGYSGIGYKTDRRPRHSVSVHLGQKCYKPSVRGNLGGQISDRAASSIFT